MSSSAVFLCFPQTIHITPSDSSPGGLISQLACGAQRCGECRAAASSVHQLLHHPHACGASSVQLSCFPLSPTDNPHHTKRQLTRGGDFPTRLWRTEVWRMPCGSELCHQLLHRPYFGRSKQRSLSRSTITHSQAIHITPSASSPGRLTFQPTCGAHKYEKAIYISHFTFHLPLSTFHFAAFCHMTHNEPLAPLGRVQDTSPTAHNRNIRHRHRHYCSCPWS